jgi:hypothetical protein
MKSKLLVLLIAILLSLLGGGAGATAGQLTQASGGQKVQMQEPGQGGSAFTYQGRLVVGASSTAMPTRRNAQRALPASCPTIL